MTGTYKNVFDQVPVWGPGIAAGCNRRSEVLPKRKLWAVSLAHVVLIGHIVWAVDPDAQDPARWEEAMRAYAALDAASPPPAYAIVFTGSSSIVLWKTIHEDMAPLTVISRGFGGSTMRDAVYWLDTLVLKYRPRAVVLYEGDNDIGLYEHTAEEVLQAFKMFVSRIQAELPETRVYFLSIKPSTLRWGVWPEMRRANDLVRVFCESRQGLHFIDVASVLLDEDGKPRADLFEADGLHLNASGYKRWASVVRKILLEHEGGVSEPGTRN